MNHSIIGANIMDRLVKCPGSLKVANKSLEEYDKSTANKTNKYAKNRIECNAATVYGQVIDEMSKNYVRWTLGLPEKKKFTKPEHEVDTSYTVPAQMYARHMLSLRKRFGKCILDPCYNMTDFIQDLPDVEFRVAFNPDFVALTDGKYNGTVYISDLTTSISYDRNKMFQVICCAVGIVDHHPETEYCICEVYNTNTREIMISKFSRDELIAYKNDIILPALQKVRDALSCNKYDIDDYRTHCSWCDHYCIFRDTCPHASKTIAEEYAINDVPIQLNFFLDEQYKMTSKDAEKYAKLYD